MKFLKSARESGFTIVELLIVITVIGILAGITIVAYNGLTSRSRSAQSIAEADQYEKLVRSNFIFTKDLAADSTQTCLVQGIESLPATDIFPEGICAVIDDEEHTPLVAFEPAIIAAMPASMRRDLPSGPQNEVKVDAGYMDVRIRGFMFSFQDFYDRKTVELMWGSPIAGDCGRGIDQELERASERTPEEREQIQSYIDNYQAILDDPEATESEKEMASMNMHYYKFALNGGDSSLCTREVVI